MKSEMMISHNKDIYTNEILFHSHDYYEIYFFADGSVKYYVENESYELKKFPTNAMCCGYTIHILRKTAA